jgi:isopentenyl phosphate kinase
MKAVTLIKLGGSLITDKTKPFTVRKKALALIAHEVKRATQTDKLLILGHGAGSFGHVPATKYQTHKGLINEQSYEGIAQVAHAARQLNILVMNALLDAGVLAVALSPMSMMAAKNHELQSVYTDSLEQLLHLGMLPVVYGDQVIDTQAGCSIFSTEKVLGYLGLNLKNKGYVIERVIHCGQTEGVYDVDGNIIPLINSENFSQFKEAVGGSNGTDVTGGMLHKVEETLALARQGIPGLIIDGIEHGSLSQVIRGEEVVGTKIEA